MSMQDTVIIYADGACFNNPGPGGWGCHFSYKGHTRKLYGGHPDTTNNRMELMAVIKSLEALTRPCNVKIYSDSKYVIDGITKWIHNWKKRNWRKVKNIDLWVQLDNIQQMHNVEWEWVRGHSGNHGNDLADKLANEGMMPFIV
jgi:ribonuclease HI